MEKRSLDSLLNVVRNNPPVTPLLADDEVEQILGRAPEHPPYGTLEDHKPNRRFVMGTIAALMLAAAGTIILTTQNDLAPKRESQPVVLNPGGARDIATLRRPDTPVGRSTPAPAPPILPRTGRGTRAPAGVRGTGRAVDPTSRRPAEPSRIRGPVLADTAGMMGIEPPPPPRRNVRGAIPRDPNPENRMMPYRLSVMLSDKPGEHPRSERDISGTHYIELTAQEAKKLGVYRNNGMIELYGEERREIAGWVAAGKLPGYDSSRSEAIVRFQATIDTNLASIGAVPNPTPDSYSTVAPVVIETEYLSTANMLYRAMVYFNRSPLLSGNGGGLSSEEMDLLGGFSENGHDADITASPSLNRLVAVHILPDEGQMRGDGGRTADVHLWYLPTKEFIDLLPDRYREILRREIATIAAVQREKLPPGTVCERMTGEPTFLDVCRANSSGALQDFSVSPNPAHESITVSLRAIEPRTVAISLHDMSGRFLKTLFESVKPEDRANRYTTGLEGVQSGAYLVVARSEKGEQVVQRLIVR